MIHWDEPWIDLDVLGIARKGSLVVLSFLFIWVMASYVPAVNESLAAGEVTLRLSEALRFGSDPWVAPSTPLPEFKTDIELDKPASLQNCSYLNVEEFVQSEAQ